MLESRLGVPPSGGGAHGNIMSLEILNAQLKTDVSPAKAGTPNLGIAPHALPHGVQHGVPALAGGAGIQWRLKELERMLW